MKYLVTGGAGFIGSHIVDALVTEGHDVVVLDNLSSGHTENLSQVWDKITFVEGDVRDSETCLKVCAGCDGVFHEAALVSVADSVERPLDNHEINITGTLNLLEAVRQSGVRRVVFASSAAVYGDNPKLPKREDMQPEPQSPYAVAKICDEYYLKTYAALYGLECVALRYFNVYGLRQDPSSPYSGVISIFVDRVLKRLPVTIHGTGEQTRDFISVKDVVSANLLAMMTERVGMSGVPLSKTDSEKGGALNPELCPGRFMVYNVATGNQNSLLQLLEILENISENSVPRNFSEVRAGDIQHSFADITKARVQLGFNPSRDFFTGLKELAGGH